MFFIYFLWFQSDPLYLLSRQMTVCIVIFESNMLVLSKTAITHCHPLKAIIPHPVLQIISFQVSAVHITIAHSDHLQQTQSE